MSPRLVLLAAILGSLAPTLVAQESKWRLLDTHDELTGAVDRRLILRAENPPARRHTDSPDKYKGATLIIACGERLPSDSGRTLLLYAGMPLEPFGGAEHGFAEVRYSGQRDFTDTYLLLLDYGETVVQADRTPSGRHTALLGSPRTPYYSDSTLRRMIRSERLTIRFRPLGAASMTAEFDLRGLGAQLPQLTACQWPKE